VLAGGTIQIELSQIGRFVAREVSAVIATTLFRASH
jgi:hypothetical protein